MKPNNSTKLQIINLLKKNRQWLSGQNISQLLGISRTAVGKHIAALRAQGYLIEAVSRRGYLLKMEPDPINITQIKKSLGTKVIGQGQWLCMEKTQSTNNQAAVLAAQGAPEGSIVLADWQTLGRGRRGRNWFSAPRSIHFSVVLRPPLAARRISLLSLLACLAMQKALAELSGLDVRIKWPNDIVINNKKVAAVLVEASIVGGEIDWAIIGIGCNLNAAREEFPKQLQASSTSLLQETNKIFPRNLFYKEIIAALDMYYGCLRKDGADALVAQWKNTTDIIGKQLRLTVNGQAVAGKAVDLNQDGILVVVDKDGREHQVEVGDVVA